VPASTAASGSVAFCTTAYARLPTGSRPPCGSRQIRMPTASTIDAVEKILRAAGLESYRAEQLRIHDDTELISS